jgi:hypothetical protein
MAMATLLPPACLSNPMDRSHSHAHAHMHMRARRASARATNIKENECFISAREREGLKGILRAQTSYFDTVNSSEEEDREV